MTKFSFLLALFIAASPAWCAKKITVEQLKEMLHTMQQDKKSDAEVATALKQVELSQQLTRPVITSLVSAAPGPQSTEQVYVLQALSANLIPPASELPGTPAPDSAGQKAILEKAATYVTKTYEQLPGLTAVRTTLRFQDNVEAVAASSGIQGSAQDVVTSGSFSNPASYIHFISSTERQVASEHGAEKIPTEKDKTPWGANTMIALESPDPSLGQVFHEAQEAGPFQFQRWELVDGRQTAVFSFSVPRKKSRLDVNVCCFPTVTQAGVATFYTATTAAAFGASGSGGGVMGNFQTNTDWHNFNATLPYHGELFIDPETGIVVRMITEAEFKATEVVHQVDTRIDYGAVKAKSQVMIAPVRTFVSTVVVPHGDSGARAYATRTTLFTSVYKDYQLAAEK